MKKNGVLDIFCKIISFLLSIVFIVALIATTLFYSVTNVLKPETLTEIITDIDYSEMLSGAVIEKVSEKHTTLSFRPVILMGGIFTNGNTKVEPETHVRYDMPESEITEDSGGKVFNYGESSVIIKDSSGNASEYTVNEKGDIVYDGQVIGNVNKNNSGENSFFVESEGESSTKAESSMTIIGGADGPTSIITAPSKNSGNSKDSFFGEITANFSEKEIEMIKSFMESDVAKEILDEYANAVNDAISGKDAKLDKEKIKKIIIDNKEQIIAFIEQNMSGEVNKEEISKEIETFIDENVDAVLEVLPEPQEIVKEFPKEVIEIIDIINSGIILRALFTVDAILALLIFLFRLCDFAGFLWLGVDGIISSVILAFVFLAVNVFKSVAFEIIPTGQSIISSIFSAITSRMLICVALMLVVSIAFIVIFSVIKKVRRR